MQILSSFIYMIVYLALLGLAGACAYTANCMDDNTCRYRKGSLVCIIIGVVTLFLAIYYNLSKDLVLLSALPVLIGFSLWLSLYNIHTQKTLDQFIEDLKLIF